MTSIQAWFSSLCVKKRPPSCLLLCLWHARHAAWVVKCVAFDEGCDFAQVVVVGAYGHRESQNVLNVLNVHGAAE